MYIYNSSLSQDKHRKRVTVLRTTIVLLVYIKLFSRNMSERNSLFQRSYRPPPPTKHRVHFVD